MDWPPWFGATGTERPGYRRTWRYNSDEVFYVLAAVLIYGRCYNLKTLVQRTREQGRGSMFDVKSVFDWAKENGEVKAVDRILIKVMLLLIKNKITLTAATIERMETRMALPEEVTVAIIRAAEEVVGKPLPDFLVAREASHV